VPVMDVIKLNGINAKNYTAKWFDTTTNKYLNADIIRNENGFEAKTPIDSDAILILSKKK
jgi:hypothetical protein